MKTLQLLLIVVSVFAVATCRTVEVLPADKEVFVRVADLARFDVAYENAEALEKFTKTRYLDGSIQVEYEFETPESDSEALYLAESFSLDPKKSDARVGGAVEDSAISVALKIYGVEKVEVPNFFKYGESSAFYVLKRDGREVGNYFTLRDGRKNFYLFMVGLYIDDPEIWREVAEPRLRKLTEYAIN